MDETTILIVDDEPRVLDALEAILAAEFRVLRANHGEDPMLLLEVQRERALVDGDEAALAAVRRAAAAQGYGALAR